MTSNDDAPLAGIRVLDISAVVAGPYAALLLADLGADVIKVEMPEGDLLRWIAGRSTTPGMSGKFLHLNRNKRSICLDLKHDGARAALLDIAKGCDVFLHNLREPAIEKLRLTYAEVAAAVPNIVYASIAGFGRGGPYRGKPAYDSIIQGSAGLAALYERVAGEPRYLPMVIADRTIGLMTANTILAALLRRTRTGRGMAIELPMFEKIAALVMAEHMYEGTFDPALGPPGDPRLVDPEARPVKTIDGYVCVTANTDAQAFAMFDVIGRSELKTDPRFSTKLERARNAGAMFQIRRTEIAKGTTAQWLERFERADIPVMPYHTLESLPQDPHLQAVRLFERVEHPSEGPTWNLRDATWFSDYQVEVRRHPPVRGEHTREVLQEAGFSAEAVNALIRSGAARET